jgi:hypothetical protein
MPQQQRTATPDPRHPIQCRMGCGALCWLTCERQANPASFPKNKAAFELPHRVQSQLKNRV